MLRSICCLIFASSVLAAPCFAQAKHRNRTTNTHLLGIVTEPHASGAKVVHVLKKSPAAKAKLKVGDVVTKINDKEIKKLWDVDDALKEYSKKTGTVIHYLRDQKSQSVKAKLIKREAYKGSFLKRKATGSTGFKAPKIFSYAWINGTKEKPAPTWENTKGKVVVFHCFQGW